MVSWICFVFAWSPSGFDDDVAFRWTHGRIQRKAFYHLTVSDWKNRYCERSRYSRLRSGWRFLTLFEKFAQQDLCCWSRILERKPGVFFIYGRLINSIRELNYQAIDKLQQGGVPDKVSWMKPSLRGRLRLVKIKTQERNLLIEDLNQSIHSKWVILWAEV